MISNCPSWLPKSIIYQVFTGRWQAETDGNQILKIDKFKSLATRDWAKLIDLGINCFYFLGIFDNRGPISVQEENGKQLPESDFPRVPSLFAMSNHSALNPAFGSDEDFKNIVKTIQNLGAKVIVDFVPNHTGQTHLWVKSHSDYYIYDGDKPVIEFSGDVYKLNYENPDLRREMINVLDYIYSLGVDGVRCDMAHLVPTHFWQEAIARFKSQNPNFTFIAEAYPNSIFDYNNIKALYDAGFDAIYNNSLFENIKKVTVESNPLEWLISSIQSQKENQPKLSINYFFNHDDPPLDNKQEQPDLSKLSVTYSEALFTLILFLPELGFIYNGSLLGRIHRLAHHWFEPLDKKYLETDNPIPESLVHLLEIRKQIKDFNLRNIWQENDLLCFELDQFRFIINLSKEDHDYNGEIIPSGKVKITSLQNS